MSNREGRDTVIAMGAGLKSGGVAWHEPGETAGNYVTLGDACKFRLRSRGLLSWRFLLVYRYPRDLIAVMFAWRWCWAFEAQAKRMRGHLL